MTPLLAAQASHLTVFQRTANYSVPAQNEPLSEATLNEVKANYAHRRALGREAMTGQFLSANDKSALEVSDDERLKEFEFRWRGAGGGFRMLRAFSDLLRHPQANKYAAEFARSKIRQIVKDPATAELLCPRDDLPFGTKRLCVDTDYYETFNRANVSLVDVKTSPLTGATPTGLRTAHKDYALDAIVFATGFDAMTGAVLAIDIRGTGGQSLREKWAGGPRTYLGLSISGFPNLFVIAGPGSPSVLSNMVHSIETHVDWISSLIRQTRADGVTRIEHCSRPKTTGSATSTRRPTRRSTGRQLLVHRREHARQAARLHALRGGRAGLPPHHRGRGGQGLRRLFAALSGHLAVRPRYHPWP